MLQPPATVPAVLFDWAGTIIDYGSRAPTRVFVEVFRQRGVAITEAEARAPMGMAKRDHLAAVAAMDRVRNEWNRVHGRPAQEADIDAMYVEFLPLQKQVLVEHADVIPGAAETMDWLRGRNIRIGSSTGYTRELMETLVPLAAVNGCAPDVVICPDDVPAGRPAPWSNLLAAQRLNAFPIPNLVVVDDTLAGIQAGRNAGMYTVAVSMSGNALGLSAADAAALSPDLLQHRLATIEAEFLNAGAHAVIRSVADLPQLLAGHA